MSSVLGIDVSDLSPADQDTLLLALLGSESRYHYYPPTVQPDGSILYAHATRSDVDGLHTDCWACLLKARILGATVVGGYS